MSRDNQAAGALLLQQFGDLLACPCGHGLESDPAKGGLVCGDCGKTFEYKGGILVSTTRDENAPNTHELQKQEEVQRDIQAKRYDKVIVTSLPSWFEGNQIRRVLSRIHADSVLEIGCGTGRFTTQLAKSNQRVVGVDRSLASLQQCRLKLEARGLAENVLLIHADLNCMPVRRSVFDLAVIAQVLQHLPTDDIRRVAVENMALALRDGGEIVVSFYQWRPPEPAWRKKEGLHPGGIYFIRYTEKELRDLLQPHFQLQKVDSSLGRLLIAFGTVLSRPKAETTSAEPSHVESVDPVRS